MTRIAERQWSMGWGRIAQLRPWVAARRLVILSGVALAAVIATASPALADDRPDGAEMATAGSMMVVIVLAFAVAWFGLWWSYKNGEYEEPEEMKYQMLALVEDEPDFWGMGTHDEEETYFEDDKPRKVLARPAVG